MNTHNWYELLSCANFVFESCNFFIPYIIETKNNIIKATAQEKEQQSSTAGAAAEAAAAAATVAAGVQCISRKAAAAAEGNDPFFILWRRKMETDANIRATLSLIHI